MKFCLFIVVLYVALLAQIALDIDAIGSWIPNLTLLIGLIFSRGRGGTACVAVAGFLCDCLDQRPLGITMLIATLVVTCMRQFICKTRATDWRAVAVIFVEIVIIESVSRSLTGTTAVSTDFAAEVLASLKIAAVTAIAAASALLMVQLLTSLVRRRTDRPAPFRSHAPRMQLSGRLR